MFEGGDSAIMVGEHPCLNATPCVHSTTILPFECKFSPVLCQRVLQYFLLNLEKGTTHILYCLDDFCIIGLDRAEVRRVTQEWVVILTKAGFVVSPKLVLEPTHELRWLGKLLVLDGHLGIFNLDGALESGWARWLKFSVAPCTRKRVEIVLESYHGWLSHRLSFHPFLHVRMHTHYGVQGTPRMPLCPGFVALPPY